MISKDQIRQANDTKAKTIPVPEWGGDLSFRRLRISELAKVQDWLQGDAVDCICHILILSLCDEDRKPLLSDDDMTWLRDKDIEVMNRLFLEVMEFNGFTQAKQDDKKKDSPTPSPIGNAELPLNWA